MLKFLVVPIFGAIATLLAPAGSVATDDILGWLIRAMLAAFIALAGWLLRDAAKTLKDTHSSMLVLTTRVDAHDVLLEYWIDDLVARGGSEAIQLGKRKSDRVLRTLIAQRTAEREAAG